MTREEAREQAAPLLDEAETARLLLSSIRDQSICMLSPDGRIRSWSAGAEALYGHAAGEVLGVDVAVLSPPGDAAAAESHRDLAVAEAKGTFASERPQVRRDGTPFVAHVAVTAIRDGAGSLVGFGQVARDVTAERAAHERLRESEERLRLTIESVKDYAIFMLDPDGRIRSWNEGARHIKGWERDEVLGRSIALFYPPEALAAGKPAWMLRTATEQGRVEDEGWRVRKDGSRFWADVVLTAVRDPSGRLRGFTKVTRDLTARKRAEEDLRASEARTHLFIDSVQDYALFMLDERGRVATWNTGAERIKGYRAEEILGRHFSVFYPREDVAAGKCDRELELAARDGRLEDEGWRLRKDGTRFWANVIIVPVRDGRGRLVGFGKVTRDLTARRELEREQVRVAQAQEGIRVRDEFLSIASHELRTPLTALQLQLEALRERRGSLDEVTRNRVARAAASVGRLAELVDALLDVSRLSTGRYELHPERVDLAELARDVVDGMRDAAAGSRCELSLDVERPIPGTWDRLRVEQVLANLLSNAIKYGAGAPIHVSVARRDGRAVLEVRDGGPGIPDGDLERVFGRFERAASLRHYGGLGLGLYVAREIVAAHGGSIAARNLPGGGACLTVSLPVVEAAPQHAAAELR